MRSRGITCMCAVLLAALASAVWAEDVPAEYQRVLTILGKRVHDGTVFAPAHGAGPGEAAILRPCRLTC